MESKVVLVTGASSGIGKAIAGYLTDRGCTVYGTARNPDRYPEISGYRLLPMEVTNAESIKKAINTILDHEGRLDILINNAGVGITGPVEETPNEEAIRVLEVNLLGPVSVLREAIPSMRKQGKGLIINISSLAGYMGLPFRGFYSASKGALQLITESLRLETAGSGIHICSLAPGDFATNIAAGRYHAPVIGGSPYETSYRRSLALMDDHVKSGEDPVKVAEKVWQIVKTRKPKVHYTVGSPLQRFSLLLKKILPDKLYEKLLLNHYKL